MKKIFYFWLSLASTSFFMALELPIITAAISRLENSQINLAAIGIVSALSLFIQSPVLRIMSLPLMMIRTRTSYYALRKFVFLYCIAISGMFFFIAIDPVFSKIIIPLLSLNPNMANLVQSGMLIWAIFPLFIGLRRFYHGILLYANEPKKIAIATFVRLASLITLMILFSYYPVFSGVLTGVLSIGFGMAFEMFVSMWFARIQVRKFIANNDEDYADKVTTELNFISILKIFIPLSFSSAVAMSSGPILSFFTSRGVLPIESLALSPVLFGILNPFTWTSFAIQDSTHAFLTKNPEQESVVRRFSQYVGLVLSLILLTIAITPLSKIYFFYFNNLTQELFNLTHLPMFIMSFIPLGFTLKNFYRGSLISYGNLRFLFISEFFEIICLALIFFLLLAFSNLPSIALLFISYAAAGYLNLVLLWLRFRIK